MLDDEFWRPSVVVTKRVLQPRSVAPIGAQYGGTRKVRAKTTQDQGDKTMTDRAKPISRKSSTKKASTDPQPKPAKASKSAKAPKASKGTQALAELLPQVEQPQVAEQSDQDLKAAIIADQQPLIASLPRLSKAVYVAIYHGLYAEPGFSDVILDDVAQRLGIDMAQAKGALGNLHKQGLVVEDAMNGQHFQHPTAWSNPYRIEVQLTDLGISPEEAQELMANPLGTEQSSGKSKGHKERNMTQPDDTQNTAEVTETLTPDPLNSGDTTPATTPKEAKAKPVKELTPEQQAALEEYKAKYQGDGEKAIDLTTHTKTGAKSRMSLEARARMSAAAKARWQDPQKKAQLQEAMAKRTEATREAREAKQAERKAAQEARKAKREEQRAAERAAKNAEKPKAAKASKSKKGPKAENAETAQAAQ